jgi:hypothetical protein
MSDKTPTKIKAKDIPVIRNELLIKQNYKCLLCNELIRSDETAVLDHSHQSGLVRAVLHRGCNALEGIITNALPRNLISDSRLENILQNFIEYRQIETEYIHPTHLTPIERKERAKIKAKKRRDGTKTNPK